ncbi:hypothetical protein NPIL_462631 [Nephila pilipes]|uniref:Uncharacterized protein n=1 Tax=Nephila pilipes TaxID=299642 RepID=A0A8X6TB95_NEPPI|nr:hypothetical protein NPIL_462631 [Nephila pilipes]
MFKEFVKSIISYRKEKNILSLQLSETLKKNIQDDIISAFLLSKPLIKHHIKLFQNSNSFFDFLLQLLDVDLKDYYDCMQDNDGDDYFKNKLKECENAKKKIQDDYQFKITKIKEEYETKMESLQNERENVNEKNEYQNLYLDKLNKCKNENKEILNKLNECEYENKKNLDKLKEFEEKNKKYFAEHEKEKEKYIKKLEEYVEKNKNYMKNLNEIELENEKYINKLKDLENEHEKCLRKLQQCKDENEQYRKKLKKLEYENEKCLKELEYYKEEKLKEIENDICDKYELEKMQLQKRIVQLTRKIERLKGEEKIEYNLDLQKYHEENIEIKKQLLDKDSIINDFKTKFEMCEFQRKKQEKLADISYNFISNLLSVSEDVLNENESQLYNEIKVKFSKKIEGYKREISDISMQYQNNQDALEDCQNKLDKVYEILYPFREQMFKLFGVKHRALISYDFHQIEMDLKELLKILKEFKQTIYEKICEHFGEDIQDNWMRHLLQLINDLIDYNIDFTHLKTTIEDSYKYCDENDNDEDESMDLDVTDMLKGIIQRANATRFCNESIMPLSHTNNEYFRKTIEDINFKHSIQVTELNNEIIRLKEENENYLQSNVLIENIDLKQQLEKCKDKCIELELQIETQEKDFKEQLHFLKNFEPQQSKWNCNEQNLNEEIAMQEKVIALQKELDETKEKYNRLNREIQNEKNIELPKKRSTSKPRTITSPKKKVISNPQSTVSPSKYQKYLKTYKLEIAGLKGKNKKLRDEILEKDEKISNDFKTLKECEENNNSLKEINETLKKKLNDCNAQIVSLKNDYNVQISNLKTENEKLKEELEENERYLSQINMNKKRKKILANLIQKKEWDI